MRIIRILVVAAILGVIFLPQITLAADAENANETNINTKVQENINKIAQIKNILLASSAPILKNTDNNADKQLEAPVEPVGEAIEVKSPEEQAREKVLARYKDKRDKTIYPEGQFTINASAYTAAADECGKSDGITASGLKVKEKHTIACPPQFPLGTKLKIDGYGTYVCEDRGGAIKGNHIDIYVQTKKEAFAFGRRNLLAEVIL